MDVASLIIQLVSGAVGGNLVGQAFKDQSLGMIGNTIAGIVGGGIGGQILQAVLGIASSSNLDIGSIIAQIVSGGVGGGVLMTIVGGVKQMMGK